MLNPFNSIPELQELSKADRKSAFQYAHLMRLKHWQFYATAITILALGIYISSSTPNKTTANITIGLTIISTLIITDYVTKPIFRKHALEHINKLKLSRSSKTKIQ